jgi:hypothetical protein
MMVEFPASALGFIAMRHSTCRGKVLLDLLRASVPHSLRAAGVSELKPMSRSSGSSWHDTQVCLYAEQKDTIRMVTLDVGMGIWTPGVLSLVSAAPMPDFNYPVKLVVTACPFTEIAAFKPVRSNGAEHARAY